ncbi:hypothetical protein EV128_12264 [Rhizobium azibense]|nr:hypothetical protein EV128_12264 [Rhizobium azibense]
MAIVTLENTKLELRRDEKGRFKLFFDGQYVPGVMEIDLSQVATARPQFTIVFGGACIRVVEQPDNIPDCGGDE